jgi:hypothetical protein
MSSVLSEIFKGASPEFLQLREENPKLYREVFDRGRKVERQRARFMEEERQKAAGWRR